ncbi:MAG: nuclear transport factor 2 family protein, partial [Rubrobacteraceae bacterium]
NPHTGDLNGPDAVLGMIREAQRLTGGTFRLVTRDVVAHGDHAVALIDWSAERDGERIEGKEVAVYRVRDGKISEASFHLDNPASDEAFWE